MTVFPFWHFPHIDGQKEREDDCEREREREREGEGEGEGEREKERERERESERERETPTTTTTTTTTTTATTTTTTTSPIVSYQLPPPPCAVLLVYLCKCTFIHFFDCFAVVPCLWDMACTLRKKGSARGPGGRALGETHSQGGFTTNSPRKHIFQKRSEGLPRLQHLARG